MHCTHVKLPGGVGAIVCASGRARRKVCLTCGREAPFLCDWKTGHNKTCDSPICGAHAEEVAEDKHLCPAHQAAYQEWLTAWAMRNAKAPA